MDYNVISVSFGALRKITSLPINYKFDIGQILKIKGLALPENYVVDFCNDGDSTTISMVGTADGVRIPDEFLQTGKPVKAYVVLSGADNTQTRYEITIPVNARPERTDIQPTPEEQSTIDSLIAAMNTAVEESEANADRAEEAVSHYPKIENGNWYVWNPETGEYIDTGIQAEGEDGVGIRSATLNADYTLTLTFTDGTSYTTPSIRGEPGQHGQDGVSPTITVTAITGGHRVEITDAEGTKTFNVMDGLTGATPDIQIGTVTTLPAGSEATAEITGTPEQPRLNLGIPEGQRGLPGEVTQAQLDTALANKAPVITDTASGAIASFPDGADGLPLKRLVAQIEPQQDLHGQDAPYPPGGGDNICPVMTGVSNNGLTATVDSDGVITVSGTATGTGGFITDTVTLPKTITAGTTVTFGTTTLLPGRIRLFLSPNGSADVNENTNSETFYKDADFNGFRLYFFTTAGSSYNFKIYPKLVVGSSAGSWSPYSNECPISGWTGCDVVRTGKNLLNPNIYDDGAFYSVNADGSITAKATDSRTWDNVPQFYLKPGTYTISRDNTSGIVQGRNILENSWVTYMADGVSTATFTLTKTTLAAFKFCANAPSYPVTFNAQIELSSTATAYEPYQGDSISVNWEDEAGTVYGGNLAINEDGSCKLTVDYAKYAVTSFSGAFGAVTNGYCVYVAKTGTTHFDADAIKMKCNIFKYSSLGRIEQPLFSYGGVSGGITTHTFILPSTITSLAEANAWLTDNPVECTFKLATPITYTLPDVTMLSSVLGTNNIWVDTGDTTVEYRADTKLYLEKLTAPTEDDLIADHAITSGSFFMVGNTLYKATAAIANGATITPGTNATRLSLADALNLLNT